MPEDTPKTPEHEGTTAPSSGKVKIVALLVGAPSVALVFRLLYRAIYGDAFRYDPSFYAVAEIAVICAVVFFPFYYAVKIWKWPTLKNLRRVPFIAAFWSVFGALFISRLLSGHWDSATEREDLFMMIFGLVTYFVVKKVVVSWLEMPELEDSGLSIDTKREYWGLYCFFLWAAFQSDALMEALEPSGIDFVLAMWLEVLLPIALAVICYRVGLRVLNLNRG